MTENYRKVGKKFEIFTINNEFGSRFLGYLGTRMGTGTPLFEIGYLGTSGYCSLYIYIYQIFKFINYIIY